jgi:hypothetical protein
MPGTFVPAPTPQQTEADQLRAQLQQANEKVD